MFWVDVTVAEREQIWTGLKKSQMEIWPHFCPIFPSVLQFFHFFAVLIVEGNVCNTLQQREAHSSRDKTKKLRLNKDSCGFLRNYAAVWHVVIWASPERVWKKYRSIEVITSEQIVSTFGLRLNVNALKNKSDHLHRECCCTVAAPMDFAVQHISESEVGTAHSRILFASTEVVHRTRSDSLQYFDIRNI